MVGAARDDMPMQPGATLLERLLLGQIPLSVRPAAHQFDGLARQGAEVARVCCLTLPPSR